jgi:FkbM family methyltransferase
MLVTVGHLAQTRVLNEFAQLSIIPFALGSPETLEVGSLPVVRGMMDGTAPPANRLEPFLLARLDWLWDRICKGERRIDGVKVDVQGMEIDALKGMASLLQEYTPKAVIEVHRGVNRADLLDLMHSLGYSRQGIPVGEFTGEGDALYLDDQSYFFTSRGSVER